MASKTVPVRLQDDLLEDLEYLIDVANSQYGLLGGVTQSLIIRVAITALADSVRETGVFPNGNKNG